MKTKYKLLEKWAEVLTFFAREIYRHSRHLVCLLYMPLESTLQNGKYFRFAAMIYFPFG